MRHYLLNINRLKYWLILATLIGGLLFVFRSFCSLFSSNYLTKETVISDVSSITSKHSIANIKNDSRDVSPVLVSPDPISLQPEIRVVSTSLATDHILAALVQPSSLAGVSLHIDNPFTSNALEVYDKSLPRVTHNIESILTLEPDLVFVAPYSRRGTKELLSSLGIKIVAIHNVNRVEDIYKNIALVASNVNQKTKGETLIKQLQHRLKKVKETPSSNEKPRVLYYDLNGNSVGNNTLINETLEFLGAINIAKNVLREGEYKISEELAISLQPDLIIYPSWAGKESVGMKRFNSKRWQQVPAVKNGQVFAIKNEWITSVSQHYINAIEALAKIINNSDLSRTIY